MPAIKFGTDGWRGVIAEDFTFANARVVAHAIARYVVRGEDARRGVIIGYDHRYASDRMAAAVAEVVSASGTPVWLADKPCPTPTISFLVRHRKAAGGIVITASHNPYRWNGIKYKASYGSSALPSIVAQIEKELAEVQQKDALLPLPPRKHLIHALEPREPYLEALEKLVDWKRLREAKLRFMFDPMHGASAGLLPELFRRNGIPCDEIRGTRDPRFGGVHPEPIEPHIEALRFRYTPPDSGAARLALGGSAESLRRHRQDFFRHQAYRQACCETCTEAPRSSYRLQVHLRIDARAEYFDRRRGKRRYWHEPLSS
jgi:phosphomannomutase